LSAYLWGKSYKKKELKRIAEWRKSRTAGYSDGFHWWIVDDD